MQAEDSIVVEGKKSEDSTNETQESKNSRGIKSKLKNRSFQDDGRQATKTEPKPRSKVPEVSVSASSAKN